jgi:predicted NodU family carbamoyl transferase
MLVLGINGCLSPAADDFMAKRWELYYHDAAAVLLRDGRVAAAVEQERLNRVKHTTAFAGDAMHACLKTAGFTLRDVDRIAFFFDEHYTDSQLFRHYATDPNRPVRWSRTLLADRVRERFASDLSDDQVEFVEHHEAHAFSAYPQSGYLDALVVVMDGAGEESSISVYDAHGSRMEQLASKEISHSLGYLYLAGTQLLGYGLFDEYKVMGLAPYGDPSTFRPVFDSLYELQPDGDFRLDYASLQPAFAETGFPLRRKGQAFSQQHKDFAAGLQEATEIIGWHVISHWQRRTGHRRLAIAGGLGQNCTFNGKLLRSAVFDDIFVHPAAHDAGAALGAALKVHVDHRGDFPRERIRQVFWGPDLPKRNVIERLLTRWSRFVTFERSGAAERETAELLAADKVVGWVQGRSEFGPRALGNRSILADPRPEANRDRVNRMVKERETYRPFAPSVQAEHLREYFEFPDGMTIPDFMVFTVPVRPDRRSLLGAVTHVDGSARVHAVDRRVNPRYWCLLEEFSRRTGVPILLNTSFNNHSEPIVDSIEDALCCYLTTRIDHLVIDDVIVSKRAWAVDDLLELAPALVPAARLRTEEGPSRCKRWFVSFAHSSGTERDVDPETYEVLKRADGRTSLRELGVRSDGTQIVHDVSDLWSGRYVALLPP